MNIERILFAPRIPNICFAEADAVDAAEPVDPLEEAMAAEGQPNEGEDTDEAELEIGPEKVRVKKTVKEAWDNLQKSVQSQREESKADKAATAKERERVREFQQHFEAVANEMTEIKAIDKQIEPHMKLTPAEWMAWAEQDPDGARKAQTGLQAYLNQRAQLVNAAQGKVKDLQERQTAEQAAFRAKADEEISGKIKDWSPAKRQELVSTMAKETGIDASEIEPYTYDHRLIPFIQDALAHRALKAKVAAKNNTPAPAATEPQPKTQTNRSSTNPLSDNVPIEQWAKNFRKQMRG